MIFTQKHGEGGSEQVCFHPQIQNEPLDVPVERFLSMIRFTSEEILKDLPLE
jgi:hypothetical protein